MLEDHSPKPAEEAPARPINLGIPPAVACWHDSNYEAYLRDYAAALRHRKLTTYEHP